jgi:hypothetical protein
MRDLVALFAGFGLGFLAAREYVRLRDERVAIEAVERAETSSMIGGMGPAPAPPPPHGGAPENTQKAHCDLCGNDWKAVVEPGQTTVVCPNCDQPTEL